MDMKPRLTRDEKLARLIADFQDNPDFQLSNKRVIDKNIDNILPPIDVNLRKISRKLLPVEKNNSYKKNDIISHYGKLKNEFAGMSEIHALLALTISYIRRNTIHNDHAIALFFRIIDEEMGRIQKKISPRWILACLRTISEYGRTDAERNLATAGYTYGTLIRNYETERKYNALKSEQLGFSIPEKSIHLDINKIGFYNLGRDNGASIINILLIQIANNKTPAGILILILLAEIKDGNTIFSRVDREMSKMDKNREHSRLWSFGNLQDIDD